MTPNQPPIIEFYKLLQGGRSPKRADRTAAGFVPSRAMRYCDALTTSTGFGYWLFPPADLRLLWTEQGISWAHGDSGDFLPLSDTATGAIQYPGFESLFDASAPENLTGYSIPYLTAGLEPGSLQMWTGLLARTRPGWSMSLRPPVNLPPIAGVTFWEGMIETDSWFGPVFTVLKLNKMDTPVRLRANVPFLQAQPIPQMAYQDAVLSQHAVSSMGAMSPRDWEQLGEVLAPPEQDRAKPGSYAIKARKRRMCPYHTQVVAQALELAS